MSETTSSIRESLLSSLIGHMVVTHVDQGLGNLAVQVNPPPPRSPEPGRRFSSSRSRTQSMAVRRLRSANFPMRTISSLAWLRATATGNGVQLGQIDQALVLCLLGFRGEHRKHLSGQTHNRLDRGSSTRTAKWQTGYGCGQSAVRCPQEQGFGSV